MTLSRFINNAKIEHTQKILRWERIILKTPSETLSRQEKKLVNQLFVH